MKTCRFFFYIILCALFCSACGVSKPQKITRTEAEQKLDQLLKDELKIDSAVITHLDNSVWLYLPLEESLFDVKATAEAPSFSKKFKDKFSINYLETDFKNDKFVVEYDISPSRSYDADFGYGSKASENYTRISQNVLTAILRAYYDTVETEEEAENLVVLNMQTGTITPQKKTEYIKKAMAPDFFVVTIADIVRGIKIESMFYLDDYRKAAVQALPPDESSKRFITEYFGSTKIINDKTGKHLDIHDITWPEFLTKQLKFRIKYHFQYSSITPDSSDYVKEIKQLTADMIQAYDFQKYDGLVLNDIREKAEVQYSQADILHASQQLEVEKAAQKNKKAEGKLYTIKFQEDGSIASQEEEAASLKQPSESKSEKPAK